MDPKHGSIEHHWTDCYQAQYIIASINIAIGIASLFLPFQLLRDLGGPYCIITGLIILICGRLVHKKKNVVAAIVALVFWSLEIVLTSYAMVTMKNDIEFTAIIFKCWFWYVIFKGITPTRRLAKNIQTIDTNGTNH